MAVIKPRVLRYCGDFVIYDDIYESIMKTLNLLTLLALIVFAGCNKSQVTPAAQGKPDIVGKWNYAADTISVYNNGVLQSRSTTVNKAAYQQFNADNTGIWYNGSASVVFTYMLSSTSLVVKTTQTFIYTIVGTITDKQLCLASVSTYVSGTITTKINETIWLSR